MTRFAGSPPRAVPGWLTCWLAVWQLGVGSLVAQAPPPAAAAPFGESIEVRLVNLDVFVTDRRGRPVEGLAPEDFVVTEDDREVRVAGFRAPRVGDAAVSPADDETEPAAGLPRIESAPLAVVVYIDNTSLLAARRDRVLRELARLAEAVEGADLRLAVVTWDGARLVRRTGFSDDLSEVERALAELGAEAAAGIDSLIDFRRTLGAIDSLFAGFGETDCEPCTCAWDSVLGLWEAYARRTSASVGRTATGLEELVASLAGLDGRKAVVYLSSGLERRPGLSLVTYLTDLCPGDGNVLEFQGDLQHRYDETEALSDLAARANAARVTLYPLQVDASASETAMTQFAAIERDANLRDGLRLLAEETGGVNLRAANQLFDRLRSDLRSAYQLAFEPAHPADGRTHSIRVELRDGVRGIQLRYRQSYRDRTVDERLADRALALLELGRGAREPENPLGVEAGLRFVEAADGGDRAAELTIRFPVERLVRLDDSAPSRVRILVAIDPPGDAAPAARQRIAEVPAGATGRHTVVLRLALPPGESRIVVGIRDETGTVASFVRMTAAE